MAFTRERRRPNISEREALQPRASAADSVVARGARNGRLGKAKAAFGGCNDKLCSA
ncbi:MAG: hypothetical protein AMXMBFR22_33240 [Phycisphaerae bacterium]